MLAEECGARAVEHHGACGERPPRDAVQREELARARVLGTWGDNSVSSCRSYSRSTGPGTSAGVFPMARSLTGEGRVLEGSYVTLGTPWVSSPAGHSAGCGRARSPAGW
jgi:hypothetical protein